MQSLMDAMTSKQSKLLPFERGDAPPAEVDSSSE